jgi:hypothetical protein
VKFIRASIKTREEVTREKTEEATSPLTTIEEQEDRRIIENAQQQLRKENLSHGEKEEIDVGRTTTLSPSEENPEQLLPNVTVRGTRSQNGGIVRGSKNSMKDIDTAIESIITNEEIVSSPTQEAALWSEEKAMQQQEDGMPPLNE